MSSVALSLVFARLRRRPQSQRPSLDSCARACSNWLPRRRSDDGRATVWDLATSKHWYSWSAHEATVLAVALLSAGGGPEGFRCRTLTHGRDGEVLLWGCPAPWRDGSPSSAPPPSPLFRVSAGVGSYCAAAHALRPVSMGLQSLLMVVPGGLESTSSAAVVGASFDVSAAPSDPRTPAAGATAADRVAAASDTGDAAVPALDVDEAGVELVVEAASSRPAVQRALEAGAKLPAVAGRPAYAVTRPGHAQTGAGDAKMPASSSGRPGSLLASHPHISCVFEPDDPSAEPEQGLGEDGLPKRAGMLMAAALLRCPCDRIGETAADAGEWALLGYDAGKISAVRTSDVGGPWSAEPMDSASIGKALEPAQALVSTSHPALHPVTALAVAPDSLMVAVGTSADFVVLVRAVWAEVTIAREHLVAPSSAGPTTARRPGAAQGLGSVFSGRAARGLAQMEHARVVRPRLEPWRAVQLPRAGVSSVAFAMGGRALIAACWDGRVRVFDASEGLEQTACLSWHRMSVYSLSVQAGASGKDVKFASGDKEGRIAVWNIALDE